MQLRSEQLNQQAQAAAVESEYVQAQLQLEADRALSEQGLIADLDLHKSEAVAASLATRRQIEAERLAMTSRSIEARQAAQRAAVEQQRTMADLRREQLRSLEVRSGLAGVVQEIPVEVGHQPAPGTNLLLVAETSRLKAELRIPATRAGEVQVGQAVAVDTRNGVVPGTVARIDPAVRETSVLVEVELHGELPGGARPEMSERMTSAQIIQPWAANDARIPIAIIGRRTTPNDRTKKTTAPRHVVHAQKNGSTSL